MSELSATISGFGLTEVGKVYGRSVEDFAVDATLRAVSDAGLRPDDVDGLLISPGVSGGPSLKLQAALGLRDLRLLSEVNAFGASAGVMVAIAAQAIEAAEASVVVCVFADSPLRPQGSSAEAYRGSSVRATGFRAVETAAGFTSVTARYALAASRWMQYFAVPEDALGAVAVGQRAWARENPVATMRTPLSIDDYHASRWVAQPLHLLDCCLVSNGAAAVVLTSSERAADTTRTGVRILGWGQAHPGNSYARGSRFGLETGAVTSGAAAFAMAGLSPADIDVCEIYDCYTYTVLVTLEDYGFCEKGQSAELAQKGLLAPGGSLPTNTGGGQLSSFYLWGMTPLIEALIQLRGEGGARQIRNARTAIVSGNGGILDHHSTLILQAPS